MLTNLESILSDAVSIPITVDARSTAKRFADQQLTPQKARQVYQNTLAVLAVNNYLRIAQVLTDPTKGESWDPLLQMSNDVADLYVTNCGHLECRPCTKQQENCRVPFEAQVNRIGYVVVQIDEDNHEATLLGFQDVIEGNELFIQNLQSIKSFIPYLLQVRPIIDLNQWLNSSFDSDWYAAESLLQHKPHKQNHSISGHTISRAKQIQWKIYPELPPVSLVVLVKQHEDEILSIRIQLHPAVSIRKPALAKTGFRFASSFRDHLPPHVELSLLSDNNQVLQTVTVRSDPPDDLIQLSRFRCDPCEEFKIQLKFEDERIIERFSC